MFTRPRTPEWLAIEAAALAKLRADGEKPRSEMTRAERRIQDEDDTDARNYADVTARQLWSFSYDHIVRTEAQRAAADALVAEISLLAPERLKELKRELVSQTLGRYMK